MSRMTDTDNQGNAKESNEISKQKQNLKSIINQITKLETRHLTDGLYADGTGFIKGDVKRKPTQQVSDIIPLKFNAQLDGIGGIVIGNVFKVNPSRLPAAYRKTEGRHILFITMAEDQKITSGQDWTTTISGQLTIIAPDVDKQATGTKIKRDGTGGNGGGSGQAGAVAAVAAAKYETTKTETVEEIKVEEKTPEQEQLEQQDRCAPGQYFDEELQTCVTEMTADVNEEKSLVGYEDWKKTFFKYLENVGYIDYYIDRIGGYKLDANGGPRYNRKTTGDGSEIITNTGDKLFTSAMGFMLLYCIFC